MAGIESLLTGRLLADRYRIEEVIGRGGMGAVYRATDERLGRQVAVKVITLSGSGDADTRDRLQQRFLREARAAAGLPHHPNVVPVYDFGTDPTLGLDFLVMELLRGEDLATTLARSGPPPLPTALHVLHEASRGVAVGHRAGLVHRDIKPGNVFLVRDRDGDLQVRVLDFGIAKLADDDTLTQLTQDGRAPHSPAYASPEQLRGLSRVTPASDVFSLGALGFQLLTGERAFTDADRNRMSLGMAVPVPSLRAVNPAISPALDEVVRKALAFDQEERFPDAGVLASVLEQARRELGDTPLPPYAPAAVAPPPPPLRTAPPVDDDRTEFLDDRTLLDPAAAAAPAPVRQPPALPPRRPEPESSGLGVFLMALILVLLLGAGGVFAWWVMGGPGPVRVEDTAPPPPELPAIEPADPEPIPEPQPLALEAALQNQEGLRQYEAGAYDLAREHFQRALTMAPDSTGYRYNYALAILRLGDPRPAAREFQRVLQQDPTRAGAHFYLGEAQLALGDTAQAVASLESAQQYATNARERGIAERRLREVRAAVLQPPLEPEPADTVVLRGPAPGRLADPGRRLAPWGLAAPSTPRHGPVPAG